MKHIIQATLKRVEEAAKKPGETWKTSSGKFGAKNKEGTTRYYSDEQKAKGFAKGKGTTKKNTQNKSGKTPSQQKSAYKKQVKSMKARIAKLQSRLADITKNQLPELYDSVRLLKFKKREASAMGKSTSKLDKQISKQQSKKLELQEDRKSTRDEIKHLKDTIKEAEELIKKIG